MLFLKGEKNLNSLKIQISQKTHQELAPITYYVRRWLDILSEVLASSSVMYPDQI